MGKNRRRIDEDVPVTLPFINKFNYQIYSRDKFTAFLKHFINVPIVRIRKGKVYNRYLNIPCAFDIEVSSFYDDEGEKASIMYVWQVCINGYCWYGRTYNELYDMWKCCKEVLNLGYTRRLCFYVHNLSYEFNNLRKYMNVTDYFAIDKRTPLYVQIQEGIEFRCSYQLSGYSLEYIGKTQLHKYHVQKAVGDLNYALIRTKDTELTKKEIGYIINDVRVVCNYIQELIEAGEDVAHIPLTKTGRVRRKLNDNCIKKDGKLNKSFMNIMRQCVITEEEYDQCKRAYAGGFTHSNPYNTNIWFSSIKGKKIIPHDIASDYPHIICTETFPMGKPKHIKTMTLDEYDAAASRYNVIADFIFTGIESEFIWDYYISKSKCFVLKGDKESNGRIVKADKLCITLTEVDFEIIRKVYRWESLQIRNVLVYASDYLPREFVMTVLDLYEKKTKLKGDPEEAIEYQHSKELLNSTYGCMCTDIVRVTYEYIDEFNTVLPDVESSLEQYNKKRARTIYYPWGVYVTAYARHKLWKNIIELKDNYVYADTDSIYAIEDKSVLDHFQRENELILEKLKRVSWERNIPIDKFMPCNIKGTPQPLGVCDMEKRCIEFKTLGAKRYMKTLEDGSVHTTIAGLSKNAASYIVDHGSYEFFKSGMHIPRSVSGRTTVTYIDDSRTGHIKDYQGHETAYNVRCGVHMEQSDYTMSMSSMFIDFIKEIMA